MYNCKQPVSRAYIAYQKEVLSKRRNSFGITLILLHFLWKKINIHVYQINQGKTILQLSNTSQEKVCRITYTLEKNIYVTNSQQQSSLMHVILYMHRTLSDKPGKWTSQILYMQMLRHSTAFYFMSHQILSRDILLEPQSSAPSLLLGSQDGYQPKILAETSSLAIDWEEG